MSIFNREKNKPKETPERITVKEAIMEQKGTRAHQHQHPIEQPLTGAKEGPEPEVDVLLDMLSEEKEHEPSSERKESEWGKSKKRKILAPKDMKEKPVFLEDTGEKLGSVFDMIYDAEKNLIGYKIKDEKTEAVLSFPLEQFEEDKKGLIFVPGWYTKAVKIIEKLEFKDRISPELTALLSDDTVSNEELYDIFIKHDNEMATYIEDALSVKEMLTNRLRVLEKQRLALKDELMDLTEKRLIKDIDRKQFAEDVMEHRRKVNILDVNINKCKELIRRLDGTSFGVLGDSTLIFDSDISLKGTPYQKAFDDTPKRGGLVPQEKKDQIMEHSYKEKYLSLKDRFEQLEEEHQELKSAVEKAFGKEEVLE
ncbi:MAG: hypothetical protein JW771_00305 [Candidatus Thermoplasmatota archaeon]|nr:hypothetical protein [Candidatus Thermoplasmatota archaeon]